MLVSPTRPITPESSWVPCRLPKPTRHPIGFFFPLPYTQVPLYMNSFFFPSPHTQMQLCGSRFFFPSPYTQAPLYSNGFFFLRRIHKYSSFRPNKGNKIGDPNLRRGSP